ncbi:xanthine dehydrogenase/oxidase isoform X1 [Folsomia candida]|uniref:xanthine dehydrogenase/oxidase isoform X1 n=1 Tax=Folsomia candida TaxID=158441 RepID=UPI001604E505|nr:xanthine dehydrogenase/oxidase isoform X1 [Folsomia candida]
MGAYQSSFIDDESVKQNRVDFFLNGKPHHVNLNHDSNITAESRLVDFIRDQAGLKGTKFMCREGGCGACVVTVKSKDPLTGADFIRAVNSCLVPVFCADGWDITTIEGLGDRVKGYHKIQDQVVKFNASQCGYCTPGMIMNFHSLTQSNPSFKMEQVEDAFDGNICRCTGYRPILDAFKAMSGNASEELKRKMAQPESTKCPCSGMTCCQQINPPEISELTEKFENCSMEETKLYLNLKSGEKWIRATNLVTLFEVVQHFVTSGTNYRIIAGNTGTGVYKNDGPYQAYLDISSVPELKNAVLSATTGVQIGAGVTLFHAIDHFQKASELPGYFYMAQISKHLKRVANTPIRNAATLGGNLMLKHFHADFPSDVFVLLDCVGAKVLIASSPTVSREYSITEFKAMGMNGKIILSINFPPYRGGNYYFKSFKIGRRLQNAHAYVNCAILMKVDTNRNFSVRDKPSIVFGGISPDFSHAVNTEIYFVGKFLNQKTISGAIESLQREVQPTSGGVEADPKYRKILTQALLYKFILGILGDSVSPRVQSGARDIDRYLMQGKQDFDTSDTSEWPLYQPISKIEGKVQASGEAEYVNDMESRFGELFGAFVVTSVANAKIQRVDASEALLIPGVERFIQAKDVPGINNAAIFYPEAEEIFISERVTHAGQAVGLILAESREIAVLAAKKVSVLYTDVKKPILTVKESLRLARDEGRMEDWILNRTMSSGGQEEHVAVGGTMIRGEFQIGSQYHFHMETQTCLCIPKEDGMDVFSASQFPHGVQAIVAIALGVPIHSISVSIRRLGGAYGAKISKATNVATACAVAAKVTNRPVRVVLDLETNMKMIGKRLPYLAKYEVGVDKDGKIMSLKCDIFCDPGSVGNEATSFLAVFNLQNCYRATGWDATSGKAITNTHPNTYCRAPGSTQGIAIIENIMEHIASAVNLDPLQVRMNNLISNGDAIFGIPGLKFKGENPVQKMIQDLKTSSAFDERKPFVDNFNKNNRWKKRGLSIVPMRYPNVYPDIVLRFPVYIAVYAADGTVNVSHAGIEMGQGINTKCAQVVAHELNIPIEKVKIEPTSTLISPNGGITGGAITSELVCHAAVQCCKQLLAKMAPVKATLDNPTWEETAMACYKAHVLLTAHHQDKLDDVQPYDIWGVTLTEVELDVLTGEFKIVRVDLIEDAGKSISPNVDIGQIEGAFVMGLGLWTTEKLTYDETTGELMTHNTWNYKPPLPRDIPEDFRITMVRNRANPYGVLGSKATGEAPLTMSVSVLFALRYALNSARMDAGSTEWYQMDAPVTPEELQAFALTSKDNFII